MLYRCHVCWSTGSSSKARIFKKLKKKRVVERFLPKNRCDQVILDPIKNRVVARSALYEAALFEALL